MVDDDNIGEVVNNLSMLVDAAQLEDQRTPNLAVVVEILFTASALISNASSSATVGGPTVVIEEIPIEEQEEVGTIIFVPLKIHYMYVLLVYIQCMWL